MVFGMADLLFGIVFWRVWRLLVLKEWKCSRRMGGWSMCSLEPPILVTCHMLCSECRSFVSDLGPPFHSSVPICVFLL